MRREKRRGKEREREREGSEKINIVNVPFLLDGNVCFELNLIDKSFYDDGF